MALADVRACEEFVAAAHAARGTVHLLKAATAPKKGVGGDEATVESSCAEAGQLAARAAASLDQVTALVATGNSLLVSAQAREAGVLGLVVACLAGSTVPTAAKVAAARATAALCVEENCCVEFGMRGGHQLLLRALGGGESDDIAAACEEAMEACVTGLPPGHGFPMKMRLDSDYPQPMTELSVPCGPPHGTQRDVTVRVKGVAAKMHGIGQDAVGFVSWSSSPALARWIGRNCNVLDGADVLEFAAGTGIPGLVAAHFARSVTMSDFNPPIVDNLRYNCALNRQAASTGLEGKDVAITSPEVEGDGRLRVCQLDWNDLGVDVVCPWRTDDATDELAGAGGAGAGAGTGAAREVAVATDEASKLNGTAAGGPRPVDVILGSDFVCRDDDVLGATRVLKAFLKPHGHAFFVTPTPKSRYGVDKLPATLAANGFSYTLTYLPPAMGPDEDEWSGTDVAGAGVDLQMMTVWWRRRRARRVS